MQAMLTWLGLAKIALIVGASKFAYRRVRRQEKAIPSEEERAED